MWVATSERRDVCHAGRLDDGSPTEKSGRRLPPEINSVALLQPRARGDDVVPAVASGKHERLPAVPCRDENPISHSRTHVGAGSAQQFFDQRLSITAGLALGDECADVAPHSGEVPSRSNLEAREIRLELGTPGGEATVKVVGGIVE